MNSIYKDRDSSFSSSVFLPIQSRGSTCSKFLKPASLLEVSWNDKLARSLQSFGQILPASSKKLKVAVSAISTPTVPLTGIIPKDSKQFIEKDLGDGGQGVVAKGKWNGTDIAIKTMESFSFHIEQIIKEIGTLKLAAHENVVTLLGVCIDPPIHIHLLIELVDGYDLKTVLSKEHLKRNFLSTEDDKHEVCC